MKQGPLVALFLLFTLTLSAQEPGGFPPDYDSIRMQISDSSSAYYYPKLLDRCTRLDTTLTTEDYRHLYFGYTFQPAYAPYWRSPYEEKLVKYYQSEKLSEKDEEEVIRLATLSLSECPFDLRQLNFLAYMYQVRGDMAMANRLRYKFSMIINAILSTGDGKSCATGFHVISTSHEYVILNLFDFKFTSQSLTRDHCDYMALKRDERGIDGIYFDINRLWDANIENLKKNVK